MNNKINYRNRDGHRLTISEYKKRRQKEIIFHLSLVGICFVLIIGSIISISIKLHKNKLKREEAQKEAAQTQEQIPIVETKVEDVEPVVEEETNPFLY